MASIWVPEAFALFTGDGTADGYAVVADNSAFYPGAKVFLGRSDLDGQRAVITDLVSTTKIGIRFENEFPNRVPTYGRSGMTAFTVLKTSTISMPAQVVRVEQPTFSKTQKY